MGRLVAEGEEVVVRPELVFGLVGALGTDLGKVEETLTQALLLVGYSHRTVRVSERITSAYEELGLPDLPEAETPLDHLMDLGDALRCHRSDGDAAAAITIAAISEQRYEALGEATKDGVERDALATIGTSLSTRVRFVCSAPSMDLGSCFSAHGRPRVSGRRPRNADCANSCRTRSRHGTTSKYRA